MPDEPALRGPSKSGRRIPVALGAAWVAGTAIAGVIYARAPASFDATGWDGIVSWTVIVGGVGIVAMPILAAMWIVQRGKAARLLTEFRRGEVLAQWTVPPQQWEAFLVSRAARIRAKPWTVVVVCFAVLLFILGYVLIQTEGAQTRLSSMAAVAALAAVGAVCLRWLAIWYEDAGIDNMRRDPRVVIGRSGIYCGGTLTLWNVNGTVLRSVRVVDVPLTLEVVTGSGKTSRVASTGRVVLELLAAVATDGYAGSSTRSDVKTTVLVPIPASRLGEAVNLARALLAIQPGVTPPQASAAG